MKALLGGWWDFFAYLGLIDISIAVFLTLVVIVCSSDWWERRCAIRDLTRPRSLVQHWREWV